MRKELLLLGTFGMLTTATLCAQEFHLQPTPQEYITLRAATTDADRACLLRMYFVVIVCYDEVHR